MTEDIEVTSEFEEEQNEVVVEAASEGAETESINEEVTVLRSPVLRSKETNEAPVDVVFLLQITGTQDYVYDCEVQNIIDVSEKLFASYPNARVSVITFGIDEAQFLGSDSEYWFKDAEELADALYKISYGKTSIYCNRGAAFEIVMEQVNFRPTAAKYVYQMVNGNTDIESNYFSQLELCASYNIIYSEVYSPSYYYLNPSYGERVEAAVEKTQGAIIRTGSTSGEEIWNHLSKNVPTEKVEYKAIIASGWQTITLDAPLDPENGVDTDGDTLLDWDEVDVDNELLVWNADGSVELPTIHECMMSGKPVYVERGLDRILGAEGLPSNIARQLVESIIYTYRIMPINSDPTRSDSEGDGLEDYGDLNPLLYDYIPSEFLKYIQLGYIEPTDLRRAKDGFTICIKPLGDIMNAMGITSSEHDTITIGGVEYDSYNGMNGNTYYLNDWYLYGIDDEYEKEIYSLIKMRTGVNNVNKDPAVSIPFREFDIELLTSEYEYENLGKELEIITVMELPVECDNTIAGYFSNPENETNYFLADLYLEMIIQNDNVNSDGTFSVIENVAPRVDERLKESSIYDEESRIITISDINNLTLEERQCLLVSRAGTISYNAFAAEIIAHAFMAYSRAGRDIIGIPSLLIYRSAVRADLGANDIADHSKGESLYAETDSPLVEQQRGIFGDY